MKNVKYSDNKAPSDYKCNDCKITNCKLWRESGFPPIALRCVDCAIKSQSDPKVTTAFSKIAATVVINEDGSYMGEYGKSDQIGWLMPAIPDEEDIGYWGYSSVPTEGVAWWKKLPLRSNRR